MIRILLSRYLTYLLIAISIALGVTGFVGYFSALGQPFNITDIAYNVLQLFVINCNFEPTVLNWPLNIARFLAPLSLAGAIVNGVLNLFSDKLRMNRISHFENHIVICGDAESNTELANNLYAAGKQFVLLNHNAADEKSGLQYPNKYYQLNIGAPDNKSLNQFAFYACRYIVISFKNDTRALHFVNELVHSIDYHKVTSKIDVVILFNDPEWAEYCTGLGIVEQTRAHLKEHKLLNIRYVNYIDTAIRKAMLTHAPDNYKAITRISDPAPEAGIFGFNGISRRLIINLALQSHYINHQKLKIHLFADNAGELEPFVERYQLQHMLDCVPHPIEAIGDFQSPTTVNYITEDNDTRLLRIFDQLLKNPDLRNIRFVELTESEISVSHLLTKLSIQQIDISKEANSIVNIFDESMDRVAAIIHEQYLISLDAPDPAREPHRPWYMLPDEIRDRNRHQADHLAIKLRSLGCEAVPESDPRTACTFESDPRFEALSKAEHNRWCAYLYYKGWKYSTVKNDEKRLHSDLVPYEELPESVKEFDRNTIRIIPSILKVSGLKAVKMIQQ